MVDLESDHSAKKRSIGPPEQSERDVVPEEKAPRVAVADNLEALEEEAPSFPPTTCATEGAQKSLGATATAGKGQGKNGNDGRDWRDIKLGSVDNLRQRLEQRTHEGRTMSLGFPKPFGE